MRPPGVTVGVVDHGVGNRRSVEKALERVGARVALTADHDVLGAADGLVVPGVGAFAAAMARLRAAGLDELIAARARAGTPVLGLCLGMQLLFEGSDELGGDEGLGLLAGRVRALAPGEGLKVPHIGWNEVRFAGASPLVRGPRRRRRPSTTCTPSPPSPTTPPTCWAPATTAGRSPRSSRATSSSARSSTPRSPRRPGWRCCANFTSICARVGV